MTDLDLARILVERLNALIADPAARGDIQRLFEQRVPMASDHKSIQCTGDKFGTLGFLNGIAGGGYIQAVYSGDDLLRFRLTP